MHIIKVSSCISTFIILICVLWQLTAVIKYTPSPSKSWFTPRPSQTMQHTLERSVVELPVTLLIVINENGV